MTTPLPIKQNVLTLCKFDIKNSDENNIIITDYLSWSKFLITVKIKKMQCLFRKYSDIGILH